MTNLTKTVDGFVIFVIIFLDKKRGDTVYKLCKSEQSAARQRALELGLLDMMQTLPFEQISITDFCDRMHIPRKAFYRYFSDKDGALYGLIDHTLMEYENFVDTAPRGHRSLNGELEKFFLFWKSQKPLLDALYRSGLQQLLINRAVEQTVRFSILPDRFLASEQPAYRLYLVEFALLGMLSIMLKWYEGGFREPAFQLAAVTTRLLTQPLFKFDDFAL